jgi:hypothetical protein
MQHGRQDLGPARVRTHAVQGKDEHGRIVAGRLDKPAQGMVAGAVDLAKRAGQALVIGRGDGAGGAAAVPQLVAGPMGRGEGNQAEVEGLPPHGAKRDLGHAPGCPIEIVGKGEEGRHRLRPDRFLGQGGGTDVALDLAHRLGRVRRGRRQVIVGREAADLDTVERLGDIGRGDVDDQATRALMAQCAPEWLDGKPVRRRSHHVLPPGVPLQEMVEPVLGG